MEKKNANSYIISALGIKPVVYNPILAQISDSIVAGIFMSQMLYWLHKAKNPEWIYKTIEELYEETYLSRRQQETAIKKWKKLKCLEVEKHGVPAKRYFHLNLNELSELFRKHIGVGLPYRQLCSKCETIVIDKNGKYPHKKNCPSLA